MTQHPTFDKHTLLQQIDWQDLRHLNLWQKTYNIALPFIFLGLSWGCVHQGHLLIACVLSYFFTITAYRLGHDLYHRALGVHHHLATMLLLLISLVSFSSLHSMRYSHLEHHRNPLGEHDEEGYLAHGTWWQALLGGLWFRYRIYKHGYRLAPRREQYKILFESLLIVGVAIMAWYAQVEVLIYQFVVMFVINACAGVFAVWGLHHDCDDTIARTERNPIINALTFGLFYHVEHHLFPAVPTEHLPKLAKRLDAHYPHLSNYRVMPRLADLLPSGNRDTCPFWRLVGA
ncbi:MAG: fatty acid desaturase [Moraxella sp.]|nr:fatty acid desaturase [Moraxella sp.]